NASQAPEDPGRRRRRERLLQVGRRRTSQSSYLRATQSEVTLDEPRISSRCPCTLVRHQAEHARLDRDLYQGERADKVAKCVFEGRFDRAELSAHNRRGALTGMQALSRSV